MRLEWRTGADSGDVLIAVDEVTNAVTEVWEATAPLIADFLNDMANLRDGRPLGDANREPNALGRLVLARSEAGNLLRVDPELYWDRIAFWFRTRGGDPHAYRRAR